jgi:hypothetical protein
MQIAKIIERVISNNYSKNDLIHLVHLCTALATAYLKNRLYFGRLYFAIQTDHKQDLHDLAIDSIASLFQRDECDEFQEL